MDEIITGFVGLDAHAESTAIGFAEAGRAAPRFVGTVGAKLSDLRKALSKLGEPDSMLIVYEADPCGYALARQLRAAGYRCEVVAPSKIPQKQGDRVKTVNRHADWTPTGVASHCIEERRTRNSWSILDAGLQKCRQLWSLT